MNKLDQDIKQLWDGCKGMTCVFLEEQRKRRMEQHIYQNNNGQELARADNRDQIIDPGSLQDSKVNKNDKNTLRQIMSRLEKTNLTILK